MTKFDELLQAYEEAVEMNFDSTREALIAHVRLLEEADKQLAIWRYTHGGSSDQSTPGTLTITPLQQQSVVTYGAYEDPIR